MATKPTTPAAAPFSPLAAQEKDWNAELFVKLYSKMALALGVTESQGVQARAADPELLELFGTAAIPRRPSFTAPPGQDPEYLLAIYNPGQYIPAGMDPSTNLEDRLHLSVLFDVVPQFSWVFKPAASTVSNSYHSILEYKEAPLTSLTPDQKQKLDDAQAYYDEHIDGYDTAMFAYLVVLDEYDAAYATQLNKGPKVPTSLKLRLKAAYDKWVAAHKEGVEQAIATIAQFEALEPSTFWYRLQERYRNGTESAEGSDFQVVSFSPPYKSWFGDAGWTNFSFSQTDMDNQENSQAIAVSGSLDMSFGIFNISGSGSYEQDSHYKKMDQTTLNFSCKLMRISLARNWMNPLIFSSTAWRWLVGSPTYGMQFSTGADIAGDVRPEGTMTVIPTAAILSKDLAISGTFDDTLVDELNRQINANASVGIGPFSIAGQFAMKEHSKTERGSIATNGITAKDVQIVALICEVLPRCPNPDNSLPWPK